MPLAMPPSVRDDQLLVGHDERGRALLLADLTTAWLLSGKTREAEVVARAASYFQRPQVAGSAALALVYGGDHGGAEAAAATALDSPLIVGKEAVLALCARSQVAMYQGRFPRAVDNAMAAVEAATTEADRRLCSFFVAIALMSSDRLVEGEAVLRDQGQRSEDAPLADVLSGRRGLLWFRFANGDWDGANALREAASSRGGAVAAPFWPASTHGLLALIAAHRNEIATAESALRTGEAELLRSGPQYGCGWLACARALVAEAHGQPGAARLALETTWETAETAGLSCEVVLLARDLVRLRMADGDASGARELVEQVDDVAQRMATPWARGTAMQCRGLAARDARVLAEAASTLAEAPRPLDRAVALEDVGRVLVQSGQAGDAAEFLERAVIVYEGLAARRDVARVDAQLRAIGVRRGVRGGRSGRPELGWEGLTRTERAVVAAVLEGLTNRDAAVRLFVSPRTIETHLNHVFAKLGVSSRAELKAKAAGRL